MKKLTGFCYISKNYSHLDSAGSKAKRDTEFFMRKIGVSHVGLPQTTTDNRIFSFVINLFGMCLLPFVLPRKEALVLQYPYKKYFNYICFIAHLKGCKVIALIHDLGSFRRKRITVEKEHKLLTRADYLIATSTAMKQWLLEQGYQQPLEELGLWDYYSPVTPPAKTPDAPFSVIYAGALDERKIKFLYTWNRLGHAFSIQIYGKDLDTKQEQLGKSIIYRGFMSSDELILSPPGDFGLVWDGESLDSCTGSFGMYLRYNTPHKASFYIRCHLPLIVWSESALAAVVREYNIGICIDSLLQLDEVLASLTVEEYQEMQGNTIKMAEKISTGHFVRCALFRIAGRVEKEREERKRP